MPDFITLTGTVGTEPRVFTTSTGLVVTSFRLATTQRVRDTASGQWRDLGSNWYTVSCFRTLAEHVGQSVHKGDRVIVSGRLRISSWSSNGREGINVELEADAIGHDLGWGTATFHRAERHVPLERVEPEPDVTRRARTPQSPSSGDDEPDQFSVESAAVGRPSAALPWAA